MTARRYTALLFLAGCSPSIPKLPSTEAFSDPAAPVTVDSGDTAEAEEVTTFDVQDPVLAEADWTDTVELDAGEYRMGCTRDPDWNCYVDEFPVRRVTIRALVAMRYEVTEGLYADILGLEAAEADRPFPVTGVTWMDAVRFANALSSHDGLEAAYTIGESAQDTVVDTDATGWRLPTEAEWEFMARAGTDSSYSGGEDVLAVAWIDENSLYTLQPPATRAPNAWGLYDLSGNVWEWTGDWLGPYPPEPENDPEGFPEGSKKVVRGGSVDNHSSYARVSLRRLERPDGSLACLGFRLVRTNGPSLRDDPGEGPPP
jgi:sulfatase modifying factor 1